MEAAAKTSAVRPGQVFISLPALAEKLGISRQRIYSLANQGRIHTIKVAGSVSVVSPDEAKRVLSAALKTTTAKGRRIVRFSADL